MNRKKQMGPVGYTVPRSKDFHIENGNRGYADIPDVGVVTFEVQGVKDREDIMFSESKTLYSRYVSDRQTLRLGSYTVPLWGEGNNLYPQEIYSAVSEDKLLPGILEKQVRYCFGKGPALFKQVIVGEGEQQKKVRVSYEDKAIQDWLDSWEDKGYAHYWDYLKNVMTDYYYVKTRASKFHFTRARRLHNRTSLPVEALSYVGSDEARLATDKEILNKIVRNEDCKFVIVGDWLNISAAQYDVYHRFDPANPFGRPVAVSFDYDKTFTKWLYAYNSWFKALREYIKASRLTPMYLNSYLKNALNAHVHVSIPGIWYQQMKEILQNICNSNLMVAEGVPAQTEYRGVKLYDDKGQPYAFHESMMDQLVACELRRITRMMTGEGKNQGKMYATINWDGHPWKFEKMPGEFKDYFDTVIKYDEYASKVLLSNMGMSSSLVNVDSSGKLSSSGSEAWYNYLLYIITIAIDEFFILRDINRAIHLNFPQAKRDGVFLGLSIDIPSKLRDTTEGERPQNTATNEL